MTLKDEAVKALKTLPFYLLTPTLFFVVIGLFVVVISRDTRDFAGVWNGAYLGILFGSLAWTLRQVVRFLWFARSLTH